MLPLNAIAAQFLDRMITRATLFHWRYNHKTYIDTMTNSELVRLYDRALHCAMRYYRMFA